jgi:hypothetical protein
MICFADQPAALAREGFCFIALPDCFAETKAFCPITTVTIHYDSDTAFERALKYNLFFA